MLIVGHGVGAVPLARSCRRCVDHGRWAHNGRERERPIERIARRLGMWSSPRMTRVMRSVSSDTTAML